MLNTKRWTILPLLIYWPVILVLTLIPIPLAVQQAGVSDKSLHFAAFLVLTFLIWFAVRPFEKMSYKVSAFWWVIAAAVLYGGLDEIFQGFWGRGREFFDFLGNVSGVAGCVILLMVFNFWTVWLLISIIIIVTAALVSQVNLAEAMPKIYTVFHFFAYGIFTIGWIEFLIHKKYLFLLRTLGGVFACLASPVGLLLLMKSFSTFVDKTIQKSDMIAASAGIAGVVIVYFAVWGIRMIKFYQQMEN